MFIVSVKHLWLAYARTNWSAKVRKYFYIRKPKCYKVLKKMKLQIK